MKGAGQGAVIVKTAFVGDIGYRAVAFPQQTGGLRDSGLDDELIGSQAEDAFDEPGEANGGQTGAAGERTGRDGLVAMGFEVFQRAGKAGGDGFTIAGRPQIARDTHYSDDEAGMVAHGKLGRQTPTTPAMRIPVQFQMVNDGPARAKDGLVLVRIKLGQFFGENFAHMTAKQIVLVPAAASFHE